MADRTVKIPARFAHVAEMLEKMLAEADAAAAKGEAGGEVDVAAVERQMEAMSSATERELLRGVLQGLDINRPHLKIGGKPHARVGRYEATYYTKAGAVTLTRSLYRDCAVRNAKTVDTVSVRAGAVEDWWLPETAKAMAFLVQNGTSREAEQVAQTTGRLPYSRCSFERVAHAVGALYVAGHKRVEHTLVEEMDMPTAAASVTLSLDRVSVPMEELRPRSVGRPRKDAPKKPISRNFRMAYCGTVTLHDRDGRALQTLRYGRMPKGDVEELCAGMAGDVLVFLKRKPSLAVVVLVDGAPEMANRLDLDVNEDVLGTPVHRLVDFWHVIEKLSAAAAVIASGNAVAALRQRWKLKLLNSSSGAASILDELRTSGREHTRVGDTRPVHDAITYFKNNGDRMDYASARRRGLAIGSGNVEATCKSLVALRMRRPGSRWKEETGEHIIQLRALALSDRRERGIDLVLTPLRKQVA